MGYKFERESHRIETLPPGTVAVSEVRLDMGDNFAPLFVVEGLSSCGKVNVVEIDRRTGNSSEARLPGCMKVCRMIKEEKT